MDKIKPYVLWVFRITMVLYTFVSGYFFLTRTAGHGDEDLFISNLSLIQSSGWNTAIIEGISIPYMLLSYFPAQLFDPHIALRLINVLLLLALIGYIYYFQKVKKIDFYLMLLFFVSTVGYLYAGINDALFIVSALIFFAETYRLG